MELILEVWTAVAIAWWVIAATLVVLGGRKVEQPTAVDNRRITFFKPVASPLSEDEHSEILACIETFVAELDDNCELLLGSHVRDEARWRADLDDMSKRYPNADVRLVAQADPNHHPNAKVSWMKLLSAEATGELWFWSDSDMVAPKGTMASLRRDLTVGEAKMMTSPYVIRRPGAGPEMLDILFVSMEFYPGVLLLGRMDAVSFGLGSGMLFEADEFKRHVDWDLIGNSLAEDFHMGKALQPVRLGSVELETVPSSSSWRNSLLHYLRWEKTIRWCRPGAFAAQLVVLPLLGWLAAVAMDPLRPFAWLGLATVLAVEAVAAVTICGLIGCRVRWGSLYAVPLWSLVRALSWVACWFPWPIVWRGRKWWSPHWSQPPEIELAPAPGQLESE
ncbi:MAG: glycosyltransferase [Dehalococcoidia bacterium]